MKTRIVYCLITFLLKFKAGKLEERFYLGKPDFSKVVSTAAYVDKSLLIKELFQHNFVLINAPRRFGKSTNMDMVKKFLQIVVDRNGNPVSNLDDGSTGIFLENPQKQLTDNYKLFKNHNLKIYRERQFVHVHCGTHPVIFVDFSEVEGDDLEAILEKTTIAVRNAFLEHKYLLESNDLWGSEGLDKHLFTDYIEATEEESMNATSLIFGLKFLSRLLHKHFKKTVFVLIDDYDAPVFDAIINCNTEYEKSLHFYRSLISVLLKENPHVERGLINGRLHLEISEFPDNTVRSPFCHDYKFAKFYGLTSGELENLLRTFSKFDKINEIKDYYDGYSVLGRDDKIYSIFSIISYLKYSVFASYWAEVSDITEFAGVLSFTGIQPKIEQLLNGEVITIENTMEIQVDNILVLNRLVNKVNFFPLHPKFSPLLMLFLCDNGYLEITKTKPFAIKVPNKAIGQELADNLYTVSFYKKKFNLNSLKIRAVNEAIKWLSHENDSSTFIEFTQSVADLFSNASVRLPTNDFELHRAMLTFVKARGNFETVLGKNNFLNGKSLDIIIIRMDGIAVIMEVLYDEQSAYDGLKQVLSRNYDAVIEKEYTTFIKREKIYLGLHLSKNKTVSVSYLVNCVDINGATNLTSS